MSQITQDSFLSSLKIQLRVIHALFMREIITRYGRHNLGFAWLFLEPMIFTLGVTSLWYFTKAAHGNDLPIVPFAVIGYSTVLLWRNTSGRTAHAVDANIGLLYHKNVKVLDVFLARMLLEIVGATLSFLLLSVFFTILGVMGIPDNFLMMIGGWFLLAWFALGLGLCIGSLFQISEIIDRFWHTATYLLFPLSGAAFFVAWLPTNFQKIVLLIPMVHSSEMIKHGYYGDVVQTFENPYYLVWANLILSFIGMYLVKFISKRVEGS